MSWAMIVFIALTAFLLLVPLLSYLGTRRLIGKKLQLVDGTSGNRVFYFYSPKCGPCRRMTPVIDKLAHDHPGIVKVDVGRDPALAKHFGIRATPTTVLVKEDIIAQVLLGARSERRLIQLMDKIQ